MNRQEYHGAIAQAVKACTGCKVEKPLSEFYPHKTGRFGRRPRCKSCLNRERLEAYANAEAPTQADLHRLFRYDGRHLWWRERPSSNFDMSRPAGSIRSDGYRRICVSSRFYLAHRLIWVFHFGVWPKYEIDHINHDRDDNRIENLRDTKENDLNRSPYKNNSSGFIGVSWHKCDKRWQARISVNGKQIHLGNFTRKEDAIQARKEAERKFGFHPNHGS
jgi:hypothetical protein